ncbi:unnamed protein product [Polarella glacialis]|uniref:SecA Wing/Scaffold domain-containing protein n=1 Tax=Polarella glacialis TaxID=89957 RepID=A0A813III0_POLGL|nr:unnamed protein product [Polarella glacialis]
MDGPADVPLASPLLSGALDEAQKQVESYFFGIRKEVYKFDLVLDQQRQVIYALRRRALLDDDEGVSASLRAWCEESMTELVQELVQPGQALDSWPWPRLAQKTSAWFTGTLAVTPEQLRQAASAGGQQGADDLAAWLRTEGLLALEIKEAAIDADAPGLRHAVRRQLLLMQVDKFWRRHLENMDFLKQSAKLRSYGQREPLVEYKLEGYKAFMGMMGRIRRNTVYSLFTFMPRPLRPVSEERLAALCESVAAEVPAALPEVDVKLRSSALGRVSEHLRLQGSLAPLGLVSQLLEEAGLPGSRAAQLRWLHACDELQLLEDEFAQAVYVGLRV